MRTAKQLQEAQRDREKLEGPDRMLANELEYTSDRLEHHRTVVTEQEARLKRLIKRALARNWSLKRIASFTGITKPSEYAK